MDKKRRWMILAIGSIALSILSLFFPVIWYDSTGYNIVGLLKQSDFVDSVFPDYVGYFLQEVSYETVGICVVIISLIGILAIIMAVIGIISMNKQYDSRWPFRLALAGLIGTAIPALVLLILYLISKNHFTGTMHLGLYVWITPLAMIFACISVSIKHRLSKEEAETAREAMRYVRIAGDLPRVTLDGGKDGK